MIPGQVIPVDGEIELNAGREKLTLTVENSGDRPIQVGSHYHFAATNPALTFDRDAARGFRLDIPAGTSVRFEPGITREVHLVALAGYRIVPGLRLGSAFGMTTMSEISRSRYAALYGPTIGDRIRLADTDLLIEVTEDRAGGPGRAAGDEVVFGGGKVIRESMGQAVATRAEGTPDLVITGCRHPRSLGRRQGRRRRPRRSHRRPRQGRQPRHHGRRPPRSRRSARRPRSSPATARSSPPAASTATST